MHIAGRLPVIYHIAGHHGLGKAYIEGYLVSDHPVGLPIHGRRHRQFLGEGSHRHVVVEHLHIESIGDGYDSGGLDMLGYQIEPSERVLHRHEDSVGFERKGVVFPDARREVSGLEFVVGKARYYIGRIGRTLRIRLPLVVGSAHCIIALLAADDVPYGYLVDQHIVVRIRQRTLVVHVEPHLGKGMIKVCRHRTYLLGDVEHGLGHAHIHLVGHVVGERDEGHRRHAHILFIEIDHRPRDSLGRSVCEEAQVAEDRPVRHGVGDPLGASVTYDLLGVDVPFIGTGTIVVPDCRNVEFLYMQIGIGKRVHGLGKGRGHFYGRVVIGLGNVPAGDIIPRARLRQGGHA